MERRRFLLTTATAAAGLAVGSKMLEGEKVAMASKEGGVDMEIQDGEVVLFQGDSITDAGRSRKDDAQLGAGYPSITANWITAAHPEREIRFLNRGISGNRVKDLKKRWKEDCLDLKPNWVSILIGVNDTWRRYDSNDPTSAEAFEEGYRFLLESIRDELGAKIILLEPFLLKVSDEVWKMREDLEPKIEVVRKLAAEYETRLIRLDDLFQQVSKLRPPKFWARDGVHPTQVGHMLITQAWIRSVSRG